MAFTSESRLRNLPDISKTYMWELFIPSIAELEMDDMVVRVRNTQIPGRTITPIESFFLGTKTFYPGRTEFTNSVTMQIEEFEDQKVLTSFNSWQELIFNYDEGQQGAESKRDIVRDVELLMYAGDGSKLEKKIIFKNAWPQSIADSALDYTGNESIKYDITLQYDFWRVKNS
jgi:hypothetical protein